MGMGQWARRLLLELQDPAATVAESGGVSLLKTRFERIDDVARQGSDAQQRVLTARSGVCRARPSRAKREFALHYNRWHISQGFVEGALR